MSPNVYKNLEKIWLKVFYEIYAYIKYIAKEIERTVNKLKYLFFT